MMTLRETIAKAIEPSIVFDGFGNHRMEVARSIADAALEAIRAAGWAVVPNKLSDEQALSVTLAVGDSLPDRTDDLGVEGIASLYTAMLTAALAAKET